MIASIIKKFIGFSLALVSTQAYSVPESESFDFIKNLVTENQVDGETFFEHGTFRSQHGGPNFQIGYTKFGKAQGEKGSIVIAPGRTESSMKYIETAYDLYRQGYSPIYAIDHRGQGFSDRILRNAHKGHVEKFEYYVDDFAVFINHVVTRDKNVRMDRLYLVTNSMGAAISTLYFQRMEEKNPFRAAFHSGPMFEIQLTGGFTESSARRMGWFLCATGLTLQGRHCNGYANPSTDGMSGWEDYDPASRKIDPNNPDPENMTHSVSRFKLRDFMWDEAYPKIVLGGPTVRWVWQTTKTNQQMRDISELFKIKRPMLIMTGEWDARAVKSRHQWYCDQLKSLGKICEFVEVPEAYHELLIEADKYRNPVMQRLLEFFENH